MRHMDNHPAEHEGIEADKISTRLAANLDDGDPELIYVKGYVTIRCGKLPIVALSKLCGEMILLASSIQRHPK